MTRAERNGIAAMRRCREKAAVELAQCVLAGRTHAAELEAKSVLAFTKEIARIVEDAHCFDCGEPTGECAETCIRRMEARAP